MLPFHFICYILVYNGHIQMHVCKLIYFSELLSSQRYPLEPIQTGVEFA